MESKTRILSQVTFIYLVLYTIHIFFSKQIYNDKQEIKSESMMQT